MIAELSQPLVYAYSEAMGQIAYDPITGAALEAFSATDAEWNAACALPKGAMVMPLTGWPAVAKTSQKGLRFFAHYSGYPGVLPTPESYNHTRLKIDVVRMLRAFGYVANVEVPGSSPTGEAWIADVLADDGQGGKVAFEIQFSSQHLKDFRARTERYTRSNVRVCWIMPEKPVAWRIAKSIAQENKDYYRAHGKFVVDCAEIIPFTIPIIGKDEYPDPLPRLRIGRGQYLQQLSLAEVVHGMMVGRPHFEMPDWKWDISDLTG